MYVPRGTNVPTTINGREFSGHALDQMQGRGFVPSAVEDVIQNGVGTASRGNTMVYVQDGIQVVVNASGKVVTVIG